MDNQQDHNHMFYHQHHLDMIFCVSCLFITIIVPTDKTDKDIMSSKTTNIVLAKMQNISVRFRSSANITLIIYV